MIWRLPHPLVGLIAGLVVFAGLVIFASSAGGFGVGLPELLVIALASIAATLLVGGWRPGRRAS